MASPTPPFFFSFFLTFGKNSPGDSRGSFFPACFPSLLPCSDYQYLINTSLFEIVCFPTALALRLSSAPWASFGGGLSRGMGELAPCTQDVPVERVKEHTGEFSGCLLMDLLFMHMSVFSPGMTPGNADRTLDPLEPMSHRFGQFVGMLSWKDSHKAAVRGGC